MRKGRTPTPTHATNVVAPARLDADRGTGYVTIADVAARYGTGREQVHRWIRRGELPALRVGKLVRVALADLDDFERRHRIGGAR